MSLLPILGPACVEQDDKTLIVSHLKQPLWHRVLCVTGARITTEVLAPYHRPCFRRPVQTCGYVSYKSGRGFRGCRSSVSAGRHPAFYTLRVEGRSTGGAKHTEAAVTTSAGGMGMGSVCGSLGARIQQLERAVLANEGDGHSKQAIEYELFRAGRRLYGTNTLGVVGMGMA
jgi:hypothetical protein